MQNNEIRRFAEKHRIPKKVIEQIVQELDLKF